MAFTETYVDNDLTRKVKKTCEKVTENLYIASNEPTLACYRIQEHVHKSFPILVDKTIEMHKNESTLKGVLYDIEYSQSSVKSLSASVSKFDSIQRMLKDCVFYKQQIDYDQSVKLRVQEKLQQQQNKISDHNSDSMLPESPSTSGNVKSRSKSAPKSNRAAFNRFSASFDFPNSFPVSVASSVSADIKSLINQLTNTNIQSVDKQTNIIKDTNSIAEEKPDEQ